MNTNFIVYHEGSPGNFAAFDQHREAVRFAESLTKQIGGEASIFTKLLKVTHDSKTNVKELRRV